MEKCNVIFPGAFKPVHTGHIMLMEKYLDSSLYDVNLTVIVSKQDREGVHPESTKNFLDKVFAGRKNVKIIISPDPSPITATYNIAGQKEYGNGIYAMGSSSKTDDLKRAEQFAKKFQEGEKYYTPGVKTIFFPIDVTPIDYTSTSRRDMYATAPISATIVRQDVRNNDFENFKTSYEPLIKSSKYPKIDEKTVREYFEILKKEVLPVKTKHMNSSMNEFLLPKEDVNTLLLEGANGGHMDHPYEINEFTFKDLQDLIISLFAGEIQDVTEKLDGQNLFASVDEHGNTIFSRNQDTLFNIPWQLEDIQNNPKWTGNPSVQHAFSNGALTVDRVFSNIPKAAALFNYDDKADGVRYRVWVNLEIIDTQNLNVIPYVESKISFHGLKMSVFDYSDKESFTKDDSELRAPRKELIDLPESEYQKVWDALQKAITKTNRTSFKIQVDPEVILQKQSNGKEKAQPFISQLYTIVSSAGLGLNNTILEYKTTCLNNFLDNSARLSWLDGDLRDMYIKRWIGIDKTNVGTIKKEYTLANGEYVNKQQAKIIKDFEDNDIKLVMKKIMGPLDKLFIKVGNIILKNVKGLELAGQENEAIKKLNKEVKTVRDAIENSKDPKKIAKLEASLQRLAVVNNEYNATEGIVFRFNGHTLKLTGAFAPLNQLLGEKYRK